MLHVYVVLLFRHRPYEHFTTSKLLSIIHTRQYTSSCIVRVQAEILAFSWRHHLVHYVVVGVQLVPMRPMNELKRAGVQRLRETHRRVEVEHPMTPAVGHEDEITRPLDTSQSRRGSDISTRLARNRGAEALICLCRIERSVATGVDRVAGRQQGPELAAMNRVIDGVVVPVDR